MKTKIKKYDHHVGCCLFEGTDDCHCAPTLNLWSPSTYKPLSPEDLKVIWEWLADPDTRVGDHGK